MKIPEDGLDRDKIFEDLKKMASRDLDPKSGMLFSHIYETGDDKLYEVAVEAYKMFMDKTMLNFTVYPSILDMENRIISMVSKLFHGENPSGNFTYGGTESIFIAMKAARDYYRHIYGYDERVKIVIPYTGHPAFIKAAKFLGIEISYAKVDESYEVDIEDVKGLLDGKAIILVGSAPSYPYGVIDDIKALSEIAMEKNYWLHVDACIGGFILPFFKMLGEDIDDFDFILEGVKSLSADLHKYGYTPKGASVILYRDREYRKYGLYINASWPGYPLVNTTILSTRSAGPLAASYAVLNYLGIKGYLRYAKSILNAKNKIINGLSKMGFQIIGRPKSSIVAFTSREIDIFKLADILRRLGWYVQLQPGSKSLGFPPSIHLTISPIHERLIDGFIEDVKKGIELIEEEGSIDIGNILSLFDLEISKMSDASTLMDLLGLREMDFSNMEVINKLIHYLPPETVENTFLEIINHLYT